MNIKNLPGLSNIDCLQSLITLAKNRNWKWKLSSLSFNFNGSLEFNKRLLILLIPIWTEDFSSIFWQGGSSEFDKKMFKFSVSKSVAKLRRNFCNRLHRIWYAILWFLISLILWFFSEELVFLIQLKLINNVNKSRTIMYVCG